MLHHWNYLLGMSIKQSLCANAQQPPLTPFILGFHVGAGQPGHPNSCGKRPAFVSMACFTIVKPQILHLETEVKGGYRL